jgi:short-subunit dehydrogenase
MPYALITGASGGIGLSLARDLAKRNFHLLLVARSDKKLRELSSSLSAEFRIQAHYLSLDLSLTESASILYEWVLANNWEVSILVNNAGYGLWESIEHSKLTELQNMMQLNMISLVNLCRLFIPILKKQPSSYILNVASTASYQAVPYLATYAATKSFVVLFSRGLRLELQNSAISVSCLSPGTTSTGFIDRAGMDALKEKAEKLSMDPELVAQIAIKGMFNKKAEIIPGFVNWISVKLIYLLPKKLIEKIALSLYKKVY